MPSRGGYHYSSEIEWKMNTFFKDRFETCNQSKVKPKHLYPTYINQIRATLIYFTASSIIVHVFQNAAQSPHILYLMLLAPLYCTWVIQRIEASKIQRSNLYSLDQGYSDYITASSIVVHVFQHVTQSPPISHIMLLVPLFYTWVIYRVEALRIQIFHLYPLNHDQPGIVYFIYHCRLGLYFALIMQCFHTAVQFTGIKSIIFFIKICKIAIKLL